MLSDIKVLQCRLLKTLYVVEGSKFYSLVGTEESEVVDLL